MSSANSRTSPSNRPCRRVRYSPQSAAFANTNAERRQPYEQEREQRECADAEQHGVPGIGLVAELHDVPTRSHVDADETRSHHLWFGALAVDRNRPAWVVRRLDEHHGAAPGLDSRVEAPVPQFVALREDSA